MNINRLLLSTYLVICGVVSTAVAKDKPIVPLSGTQPLTLEGDIASQLVDGVDKFLLRKLEESIANRERHWKRDFTSPEAYNKSIEPNRKRLAHILGVRDQRVKFDALEYVGSTKQAALVGKGEGFEIYAVRWPVLEDPDPNRTQTIVFGEGLLLVPARGKKPVADVIAIPDCEQTPEQIVGLVEGVPMESQFARHMAEYGFRVIVPALVNRQYEKRGNRIELPAREYLYRASFELGRHAIGYEVQKVLACVDWFASSGNTKITIAGYREGGLLAFYAAAIDPRIQSAFISGYFGTREAIWREPIDRNVFGLLDQFGDAELAAMIRPRPLHIEVSSFEATNLPSKGAAPGLLSAPKFGDAGQEWHRASVLTEKLRVADFWMATPAGHAFCSSASAFACNSLRLQVPAPPPPAEPKKSGQLPDSRIRQKRMVDEIDLYNQLLLRESPFVRKAFMKKLDDAAAMKNLAEFEKVAEEYRTIFKNEVIGSFDDPLLPANARTRKIAENEKWTQYEVVLDVWQDVIAYGILIIPKNIKENEKRALVVCQHGLEGRPQDVIGEKNHQYYKAFATQLAERGFITFAPQNLYIFQDRFRTLQRKANPLGKTLFSIIVPQHQQITDWLKTLPMVDGDRIGFYGLSYGGKSAMRIPPLVKNYALSICSADFNEWVDKNASTRDSYSYVWTGEYEIFEWDLGSTFNYAEMAALIAPRPFMVERGHFDGVGIDEKVAHEYAKVRHLYQARLGIGDRTEIEWFPGPHTINGVGTYDFLHKWLKHPKTPPPAAPSR